MSAFGGPLPSAEEVAQMRARWKALPPDERARRVRKDATALYVISWLVFGGTAVFVVLHLAANLQPIVVILFLMAFALNLAGYLGRADVEDELLTPAEVTRENLSDTVEGETEGS